MWFFSFSFEKYLIRANHKNYPFNFELFSFRVRKLTMFKSFSIIWNGGHPKPFILIQDKKSQDQNCWSWCDKSIKYPNPNKMSPFFSKIDEWLPAFRKRNFKSTAERFFIFLSDEVIIFRSWHISQHKVILFLGGGIFSSGEIYSLKKISQVKI